DQEGSFWHYVVSDQNPMLVTELRPEQGYQYQMMAYCAFEQSNWTPVRTFSTPPAPPPTFVCGAEPTVMVVENLNPLQQLRPGDVTRVGRDGRIFRISEVTASRGNGVFDGYGQRVVPMLGDIWIVQRFENVQFNELYQVMSDQGFFVSVFDRAEGGILDFDRPQEPPPTDDPPIIEVPIIIADNTEVIITDSDGNPITDGSSPPFVITITDPDGEEIQITVTDFPAIIVDGTGTEYIVNRDGTVERKTIEEERPGALAEQDHQFYIQINDNTTRYRSNYFAHILASDRENILSVSTSTPNIQFDVEDVFWSVDGEEQEIEKLKISSARAKTLYVSVLFTYTIRIDADSEPRFQVGQIDSLRITFFEGGLVLFAKADSNTGDFGFDDAQLGQLRTGTTYRREQIGGITYYVPWMSIRPNAPPANIRIRPQEMNFGFPQEAISEMEIELISIDPSGAPSDFIRINGQNSIRLPASQIGRNIGITVPRFGRGYIVAYAVLGDVRQRVGKLDVEAKDPIDRTFRVVYVKKATESSFPVLGKADINHFLNNYSFNQVFVSWHPDDTPYRNQLILSNVTARDSSELWNDIRYAYQDSTGNFIDDQSPYYIFIVSEKVRGNITTANGLAGVGERHSLVFNQSLITTTHELGHNLGLRHIFTTYPAIPRRATQNFMDWPRGHGHDVRAFFHKFQRNILHP
ncbi:MAG: hypothetical protein FWC94_07215, partial [Bacteroidales bacterium]|nr:hypothetical protein [Bacteroidales bacterium]